jgi:hypothetical protein
MFKKFLSPLPGAHKISRLLNLTCLVGATVAITSPAFAQSSTIIYQRTTTYDNYPQYIYTNPYPINPITGQVINNSNSLFPSRPHSFFDTLPKTNLFPATANTNIVFPQTVYRRQRVRQYINESTLVNPVLVNPNIRNSTIINPTIINNPYYRHQPRKRSIYRW